jgi:polar amino acid transport system substrate-binding protein
MKSLIGAFGLAIVIGGVGVIPSLSSASVARPALSAKASTPAGCSSVQTKNPSVVGKSLVVGSDPEEKPFESINSAGKVVGFDIDLMNEVTACLGATYKIDQIKFAGLIPALQAKHIQAVISSIVATPARLQVVNFIGYLRQQEGLLVKKGNPLHLETISDLCGHTVSVFPGSLELAFVQAEGPKCTAMGKKAPVAAVFDNLVSTELAIINGRAEVSIMPPPYSVEAEQANPGKLSNTPVIAAFNSTVGIALPKSSGALGTAFYDALKVIQSSGDEAKLMTKWGLTSNLFQPTVKLS